MKIFRLSRLLLCSTLMLAFSAQAEPLLNGMAISAELGKDRFIAAIYTQSLSKDANALLSSGGERRMELKVVADRFSARSLNSMWIEGMAINNPGAALEREADNMAKLNNMVRKSLTAGDVLRIDTAPGQGVTIALNGVELGTINSDEFFSMLLRTWIGPVPLSTDFKESLLAAGDVDAGVGGRYAAIEPSQQRIDAVAAWVSPSEPEDQTVAAAPTNTIVPPRPEVNVDIAAPPLQTARPQTQQRPAANQQAAASTAPTSSTAAPASTASTAANTGARPQSGATPSAEVDSDSATDTAAVSTPANNSTADAGATTQVARANVPARPVQPVTPRPAPEDDEEEEEEVVVSGASILARQLYVTDVIRQANRVLEYPRRALQRNQQGSVRLAVTVDREGQVLNVTTLEESKHNLLNKEALDLIGRAAPFPPLPDALKGPSLTFTVPVVFVLTAN